MAALPPILAVVKWTLRNSLSFLLITRQPKEHNEEMNQLDHRINQLKLQIRILEEQLEASKRDLKKLEDLKIKENSKEN